MSISSKRTWISLQVARGVCYIAVAVSVGRAAPFRQQTQSVPDAPVPIFRAERNEVEVVVMVSDAKGQPVSGLTQSDFQIRDNGKLQTISSFAVQGTIRQAVTAQPTGGSPMAIGSETVQRRFIALFFACWKKYPMTHLSRSSLGSSWIIRAVGEKSRLHAESLNDRYSHYGVSLKTTPAPL
jgi:hypothetical protein